VLLSGDSEATTAAVARGLGFAEHRGRLSPEDKAAEILRWREGGAKVAMVGDGINDAPALAAADIAVTVAGGTDVAGETSDVVLARPDLRLVPYFLRLSAATRRITRENLGWALAYNAVAVPLAATGRISPAIAAAAMAASSLIVVGNSLRLGVVLRRPASARATPAPSALDPRGVVPETAQGPP
jgi:P-type E1-E2 ATPase